MTSRAQSGLKRVKTFQWTFFWIAFIISFGFLWNNDIFSASSLVGLRDFWAHDLVLGDVTDFVNVFIGTAGEGHVFPGATLPHGMVKVGMDTDGRGAVSHGCQCNGHCFTAL